MQVPERSVRHLWLWSVNPLERCRQQGIVLNGTLALHRSAEVLFSRMFVCLLVGSFLSVIKILQEVQVLFLWHLVQMLRIISVDDWFTTVCYVARSKVKIKVTWRWKLEILPFSKSISSTIFNGSWQMTADSLTRGGQYRAGFFVFVIVSLSRDFELGRTWLTGGVDRQSRTTGLNLKTVFLRMRTEFAQHLWRFALTECFLVCMWKCGAGPHVCGTA